MDLSALTGMFAGIHAMLAMQLKIPELAISEMEAKEFARATQDVLRHYSVQTTQKTLDWIAFAGITGGIYGPRVLAINMRRKDERRAGRGRDDGRVVIPLRPRGRTGPQPVYSEPPARSDVSHPTDTNAPIPSVFPEDVEDMPGGF